MPKQLDLPLKKEKRFKKLSLMQRAVRRLVSGVRRTSVGEKNLRFSGNKIPFKRWKNRVRYDKAVHNLTKSESRQYTAHRLQGMREKFGGKKLRQKLANIGMKSIKEQQGKQSASVKKLQERKTELFGPLKGQKREQGRLETAGKKHLFRRLYAKALRPHKGGWRSSSHQDMQIPLEGAEFSAAAQRRSIMSRGVQTIHDVRDPLAYIDRTSAQYPGGLMHRAARTGVGRVGGKAWQYTRGKKSEAKGKASQILSRLHTRRGEVGVKKFLRSLAVSTERSGKRGERYRLAMAFTPAANRRAQAQANPAKYNALYETAPKTRKLMGWYRGRSEAIHALKPSEKREAVKKLALDEFATVQPHIGETLHARRQLAGHIRDLKLKKGLRGAKAFMTRLMRSTKRNK